MQQSYGTLTPPAVLIHGGAGKQDPKAERANGATAAAEAIAKHGVKCLQKNMDPLQVVVECLKMLEDNDTFNAGFGAALQADGVARLTAAVMDGRKQTLSGVMLATNLIHPSELAAHLQTNSARVLSGPGPDILARMLKTPVESPVSAKRAAQWSGEEKTRDLTCDTVGVVVLTSEGKICAGTSTGGRGHEFPGRVSDAATCAGNYATAHAGVSCTGTGEEIVDDAVAARIETRVRDGLSLEAACRKTFAEATDRKRDYGWIALDAKKTWGVAFTSAQMIYAVADSTGSVTSSKSK